MSCRNDISIADIRQFVTQFVSNENVRQNGRGLWGAPLTAVAPVDARFDALPRIAILEHLHPRDLLASARSVVVFYIPLTHGVVELNRAGDRPRREWGLAYLETNDLINRLSQALVRWLGERGFPSATSPATHDFTEQKLAARWSHRHLGHLVNLGRMGVHNLLITPAGCSGRLGSLVTEADLGEHAITQSREACLLKAGKPCGLCIDACPVGALSATGFDRRRCWERLKDNRSTLPGFADLPPRTHVCGKCVSMMPCSFTDPVARLAAKKVA
jgi:epoxyqueuosine reductase QueG